MNEPATHAAPSGSDIPPAVFVAHLDARWGDLDAFNHVNNSTYLTYLEEARLQWLQTLTDWHGVVGMPVVAAAVVNYRRPISWPERLAVQLSCTRLGSTSLTLAHRIVSAGDTSCLYSDGHVVMVWMDPASGRSVALPASVRAAIVTTPAQ